MLKNDSQYLWCEKYRPQRIQDTILQEGIKETFQKFVEDKNVPTLLLIGPAGTGKTTVARAMLDEIGADYMIINSSLNANKGTLQNDIQQYASSVSFGGGRKYVILDEADGLHTLHFQPALRGCIEEFAKGCGFILTANFPKKIIEPIHSRCSVIDFKVGKKDFPALAKQFMKRACSILEQEGIEYDKAVVAELIKKFGPNWRRILNEMQRYSACGKIDTGILSSLQEISLTKLIGFLKEKDFTNMRKWVAENVDDDPASIYRQLYDSASEYVEKSSIPMLVLTIARYQYQQALCADPEINLVACLTELMLEISWK